MCRHFDGGVCYKTFGEAAEISSLVCIKCPELHSVVVKECDMQSYVDGKTCLAGVGDGFMKQCNVQLGNECWVTIENKKIVKRQLELRAKVDKMIEDARVWNEHQQNRINSNWLK